MSQPIAVTESNFESTVLQSAKPVVVDLWAPWCGPCRMIGPIIDEIAEQLGDRYHVTKLNVDEETELASRFRVRGIPTLLFFKDGELQDQIVGLAPKKAILSKLEALEAAPAAL